MSLSTALDSVARLINFKRRRGDLAADGDVGVLPGIDIETALDIAHPPLVIAHVPPPPAAEPARAVSLAPLTEMLSAYLGKDDIKRVREAYRFSDEAHLGQFRSSGDAYISHPIAVAETCAGMKLDVHAIMAALLHDVIEDQAVTKEDLLDRFGAQVADLVDGLSKLDRLQFRDSQEAQAENFRKMLLAMARDVRVILIKLADRLHNMRTLGALSPEKRRRIARETLDIYTPIAHRLGLNAIYRDLQDLAFMHLYPLRFAVLRKAILAARGNRREVVGKTLEAVRGALPAAGIRAEVFGREKTMYGVYRKMSEKKLSFSQVLDVYGFRIVVPDHATCYLALGALHALFKPVALKFKDYIAIPKINGYQSLHTTVLGPFGTPVEFQIRTRDMHRVAESGVAAHWLYRTGRGEPSSDAQTNTHEWLQSLLDIQNQTGDPAEFLEHIKVDLFPETVYVFTPKSKIITLPRGATPIDFAYQIHTAIGNTCIAARINGQLSPLRSELQSGDVVEVVTSPTSRPNPNWLSFVRTGRARSEIRHYLKTVKYEESVDLGRRLLEQALRKMDRKLDALTDADWNRVLYESGAKSRDELLADLGLGRRLPGIVARRLAPPLPFDESNEHARAPVLPVSITSADGVSVRLANCCRPIPGDAIFGHIQRGHGFEVHTTDCPTAARQKTRDPDRWIDAQWDTSFDVEDTRLYNVKLDLSLKNERGVLARAAVEVSDTGANLAHVSMDDEAEEITLVHLMIQVHDRQHLARVMRRLKRLPETVRVTRMKG